MFFYLISFYRKLLKLIRYLIVTNIRSKIFTDIVSVCLRNSKLFLRKLKTKIFTYNLHIRLYIDNWYQNLQCHCCILKTSPFYLKGLTSKSF